MKPGEIIPAKAPDLDANVGLKEITLTRATAPSRWVLISTSRKPMSC